jgi:hypothetical protein
MKNQEIEAKLIQFAKFVAVEGYIYDELGCDYAGFKKGDWRWILEDDRGGLTVVIDDKELLKRFLEKDHDKKSVIEEPEPISLEAEQLRTSVKQFLEKGSFDNPPEPPRYYGKVDDEPFKGKRSEYKIFDSKP